MGAVQSLGDQTYVVEGGKVVTAMVGESALDPGATLNFSMVATVAGLQTAGSASFDLEGTSSGVPVSVSGQVVLGSAQTVAQFLPGQAQGCPPSGQQCSELPVLFGGNSTLSITSGALTTPDPTVFQIENPYFNPFGAPIVLGSADGAVIIVATYSTGRIVWQGTTTWGPVLGTLGASTAVSGALSLVSTEVEDLVAGTAVDNGTISLSSMSPSFLDLAGKYTGTSSIPPAGPGSDCSTVFGMPAGSGVCAQTGFDSSGQYTMEHGRLSLVGSYSTIWAVPALSFASTGEGLVTSASLCMPVGRL